MGRIKKKHEGKIRSHDFISAQLTFYFRAAPISFLRGHYLILMRPLFDFDAGIVTFSKTAQNGITAKFK